MSLKPPIDFAAGPLGQRIYVEVTGGEATGARFNARAVGGAGDWIVVGPDCLGRIDVRLQFETEDNAHVYVQYFGLLELDEVAAKALAAGTGTKYEDQ